MKKVISMMALVAFLFAGVVNAQEKQESKDKTKTEKKEAKKTEPAKKAEPAKK